MPCGMPADLPAGAAPGLAFSTIFQDDAAMGAGTFEGREVNAFLLGNALRQG